MITFAELASSAIIKKQQRNAKQVIDNAILTDWFKDSVRNIVNKTNRKYKTKFEEGDIFSELYLILIDQKPQLIIDLDEKNQLKFYTVRVLLNMFYSNKHQVWKKYLNKGLPYSCSFSNEIPTNLTSRSFREEEQLLFDRERKLNNVTAALKQTKVNTKGTTLILWEAYQDLGSISKVAQEYGVSRRYADYKINSFKEQFKEYFREQQRKTL